MTPDLAKMLDELAVGWIVSLRNVHTKVTPTGRVAMWKLTIEAGTEHYPSTHIYLGTLESVITRAHNGEPADSRSV